MAVEDRDVRRQPLSEAELRALLAGRPARTLYSPRSPANQRLGITAEQATDLDDDALLRFMAREPRLIRRPTIVADGELIVGWDASARARLEEALDGKRDP